MNPCRGGNRGGTGGGNQGTNTRFVRQKLPNFLILNYLAHKVIVTLKIVNVAIIFFMAKHLVLRFFLGNNNPVGNGLLGFLGGFGAAAVTHSVLGNPCG